MLCILTVFYREVKDVREKLNFALCPHKHKKALGFSKCFIFFNQSDGFNTLKIRFSKSTSVFNSLVARLKAEELG